MVAEQQERPYDLTLIGAGLNGFCQMTIESIEAISSARVLYYSRYNLEIEAFLEHEFPAVRRLAQEDGEYAIGAYRPEMYDRIAERVVDEAGQGPGVVALNPGSATVVDSDTQGILTIAEQRGLQVRVLSGISCIEGVLSAVGYDVAGGLQVYLAQDLALRGHRLAPEIASIVIQPGYFDTRFFAGAPRSLERRFAPIYERLAECIPPHHPMALVILAVDDRTTNRVFWFRLEDFEAVAPTISPYHTLFVPPVRPGAIDQGLLARVESWAALLEHVEVGADGAPVQQQPMDWYADRHPALSEAMIEQSGSSNANGGGIVAHAATTERLQDRFADDGYLIVREAIPADVIDGLRDLISGHIDTYAAQLVADGRISSGYRTESFGRRLVLIQRELGADLRTWHSFLFARQMHALASHAGIVDVLKQILGPEVTFHGDYQLTAKLPGSTWTAFPWHQDVWYYGLRSCDMAIVTVWLPLVPTNKENGCLRVIPGSHKWGLLDARRGGDHNVRVSEDVEQRAPAIDCELNPGDALFLSQLTFHASEVNLSQDVRWTLDLGYSATTGSRPHTELERASREYISETLEKDGRTALVVASDRASKISSWDDWQLRHEQQMVRLKEGQSDV